MLTYLDSLFLVAAVVLVAAGFMLFAVGAALAIIYEIDKFCRKEKR